MKNANLASMEETKRQVELFIEILKKGLIFRGFVTFERRETKRRNTRT